MNKSLVKSLLVSLVLFTGLQAFSQNPIRLRRILKPRVQVSTDSVARPVGTVFTNDFTNWTYFGTGGATFSASAITMTGGNSPFPGINTLGLRYNTVTSYGYSTFRTDVVMTGSPASGAGFLPTKQAGPFSLLINYGTPGQLINCVDDSFEGNSFPLLLPFTSGDTIRFTTVKAFDSTYIKAVNITQDDSLELVNYTSNNFTVAPADRANSGAYYLYINNWAGTNKVITNSYSSTDWIFADMLYLGTSKTAGFYCGTKAERHSNLYQDVNSKKVNNWATSSGTTWELLLQVPEIITSRPKNIYVEIGCNDVRLAVSQDTIEARINAFISHINTYLPGTTVYWQESLPETYGGAPDFVPLNTFLATLPNFIPIPGDWNSATMLNPDDVHINALGNISIYNNNLLYFSD